MILVPGITPNFCVLDTSCDLYFSAQIWPNFHVTNAASSRCEHCTAETGGDQECRYDIGTNILAGSESSLLLILSIYTDRYQEIGLKTDNVAFTWRFSMQIKQMRVPVLACRYRCSIRLWDEVLVSVVLIRYQYIPSISALQSPHSTRKCSDSYGSNLFAFWQKNIIINGDIFS